VEVTGDRPIGAESIGVAVSGDNARIVVLPAEAVHWAHTVQAPQGGGFLPASASGVFVGRERELTGLREMLTGEGSAAVVQLAQVRLHAGVVGHSRIPRSDHEWPRRHYSAVVSGVGAGGRAG
jgi:hypothetical protein